MLGLMLYHHSKRRPTAISASIIQAYPELSDTNAAFKDLNLQLPCCSYAPVHIQDPKLIITVPVDVRTGTRCS